MTEINARVDGCDWTGIVAHLDANGWATIPKLLTASEAAAIAGLYDDARRFRSHIVMARHGFGRGDTSTSRILCPTWWPISAPRCTRG